MAEELETHRCLICASPATLRRSPDVFAPSDGATLGRRLELPICDRCYEHPDSLDTALRIYLERKAGGTS